MSLLVAENLPVATFRAMRPWYALLTLQMLALQREGYDVGRGVETTLTLSAAEHAKPTQGLETAEEQLDMLSGLPLDLQVRLLQEFLRGDSESSGDLGALIEAWQRGDDVRLEREVFAELERDPALLPYYERFYFERNDRMAEGIAARVDQGGRWFVAVGAAHVVGARGIPSLLEREGYRVLAAKDGVDALELMKDARPAVMLVDIEMPRMDGYDLTRNVHFVRECAARSGKAVLGLSHGAAEKLLHYAWTGNVRELANCIERAVALTDHEQILVEDLPERIRAYGRGHVLVASDDPSELVPLEIVEQRYIARVMESVGGNKTLAARILGLDRKTLYRKLRQAE